MSLMVYISCLFQLREVRFELARAKSVFVKRLSEHVRKLMWVDAGTIAGVSIMSFTWDTVTMVTITVQILCGERSHLSCHT